MATGQTAFAEDLAVDYILSRQDADGGFCFYRAWGVEESTAPDTFYAVASLQCLCREIPRQDPLIRTLRQQQSTSGDFPSLTVAYFALSALRRLGADPVHDPRPALEQWMRRLPGAGLVPDRWSSGLRTIARCVRLAADWSLPPSAWETAALALLALSHDTGGGGYGVKANPTDTYHALLLQRALGKTITAANQAFAHHCEDPVLGIRMAPDSASTNMETIHAALRTFSLLNERPRFPAAIGQFLRRCQHRQGGFGRTGDAIATLESTWRAIAIRQALRHWADNTLAP
ncbi:prenyltransferase/squalene oxidase repeat-containing protein [Acidithiobacillus sulfuriphilus]|uniref:prenyltransferase/squalene oxidase repeat-containing protein n=1 Tax=Acidithiobacillus sulfuriphilus TaxID=1867749 RepID=UPI003F5DD541